MAGVKLLLSGSGNSAKRMNDGHVACFAHVLNLIVSKSLGNEATKDFVKIIEKVKAIVAYFKHSNVAQDQLREKQRKEGKSDGTYLNLIQEIVTRWNSTLYCLERFVLLSGYLGKILLSPHHKKAPPMVFEIAKIEECFQLLRPFEAATKDISGEKYVSASLIIPLINCQLPKTDIWRR